MTSARALHVRCSTWDQVELFTTRKLRHGRLLSMKVPFDAKVGAAVTLGLELPNQLVIAIDGFVRQASAIEAHRTWIEVELTGSNEELLSRISAMVSYEVEPPTDPQMVAILSTRSPEDLGKNELPADERDLFHQLSSEIRRLRAAAVHDVLGVPADAPPELARRAWKQVVQRYHPDNVASRQAPALVHLAEELTILVNRAYDRMRAALVAEGRGVLVGSSVASPPGWLVGFEDMASGSGASAPSAAATAETQTGVRDQGGDALAARARAFLEQGQTNDACGLLSEALVMYPYSKRLRSLFHVASALASVDAGEMVRATTELEAAMVHHKDSEEATRLLDYLRTHDNAQAEDLRGLLASLGTIRDHHVLVEKNQGSTELFRTLQDLL